MDTSNARSITLTQFANAYVPFGILLVLALLAAEQSGNLNLYRTIYTIWATTVLLNVALCFYIFRYASRAAYNYWLLFWTFSYVAYLFHFFWAVFLVFGGIRGTFAGQGPLIASTNFLITVWWGFDVALAWFVKSDRKWIRIQRALAHLFIFAAFVVTAIILRGGAVRWLGIILAVSVSLCFLIRLIICEPQPETKAAIEA